MSNTSLSVAAIILAILSVIITLCIRFTDTKSWDFDMYGALIGILGVFITLLLGWQIFNSMNAKDEMLRVKRGLQKEFNDKIGDVISEHDKTKDILIELKAQVYFTEALSSLIIERVVPAFASYIKSAYLAAKIKKFGFVGDCLNNIDVILNSRDEKEPPSKDLERVLNEPMEGVDPFEFLKENTPDKYAQRVAALENFRTGRDLWEYIKKNNNLP